MWNAAGNNMVVGTDMTVDTSSTATNLFTVTSTGQTKLQQPVYTSFKGKSYRTSFLLYVILLIPNQVFTTPPNGKTTATVRFFLRNFLSDRSVV